MVFRTFILRLLIVLSVTLFCAQASSQSLAPEDRQALLYAPQLQFTKSGEPLIRLGVAEDQTSYDVVASSAVALLPNGTDGARVEIPSGERLKVSIIDAKPGVYQHAVVVERIPLGGGANPKSSLDAAVKRWRSRGYKPEVKEVGGYFSVGGRTFDTRQSMVVVNPTSKYKEAVSAKRAIEDQYGVFGSIHSSYSRLPSGKIEVTIPKLGIKVVSPATLKISGLTSDETYFTISSSGSSGKGKRYVGELVFAPGRDTNLVAMVETPAERVLKGTVPSETFPNAPQAALQAQAVAARNNLLSSLGIRNLADPYMMRIDVMDQVYGGVNAETKATNLAVDKTRGLVMIHDNVIINAVYSSNAGGHTENNEDAWDMVPVPWLRGRSDAQDPNFQPFKSGVSVATISKFLDDKSTGWGAKASVASKRHYRWERDVTPQVVTDHLKKSGIDIGDLTRLKVEERGKGGRVKRVTLTGTKGRHTIEGELAIRRLFGQLKSALFLVKTISKRGKIIAFKFKGAGYGHGVGMCQTGAIARAEAGQPVQQILKDYYSGVTVEKIY